MFAGYISKHAVHVGNQKAVYANVMEEMDRKKCQVCLVPFHQGVLHSVPSFDQNFPREQLQKQERGKGNQQQHLLEHRRGTESRHGRATLLKK